MKTFWQKKSGNMSLNFEKLKVNNNPWIQITVWNDEPGIPRQNLLHAVYPNLDTKNFENAKKLKHIMSMLWLEIPSFIRGQVDTLDFPEWLRPLGQFFLQYTIQRIYHEHGYKYESPYQLYWDPVLFDFSTLPPELDPKTLGKVLLSWSGGKDSQMGKLVLDTLEVEYDTFCMYENMVPTLDFNMENWDQNYQCYMVNHFLELGNTWIDRLYLPYEKIDTAQSTKYCRSPNTIYMSLSFSHRLLAMFYAAMKGYEKVFICQEYETNQIYRTENGLFFPNNFLSSQIFDFYLSRFSPIPTNSAIVNFNQVLNTKILADRDIKFNSCHASPQGDFDKWCGKCQKCRRIKAIFQYIGEKYHGDIMYYQKNTNLDLRERLDRISRDILTPGYIPKGANPLFSSVDDIFDPPGDKAEMLHSNRFTNVWNLDSIHKLCQEFSAGIYSNEKTFFMERHQQ